MLIKPDWTFQAGHVKFDGERKLESLCENESELEKVEREWE